MPIFSKASGLTVNHGNFTDISINQAFKTQSGLEKLLGCSIPGAAYDSSDRYPPPLCHPGTRDELIEKLMTWGRNDDDCNAEGIAWVKGPAGAGKSALCQSSAEKLGKSLGASFFFSRPNHRSDPKRFFTTIAYQLATKCKPYGKVLDEKILQDPTIIMKSLSVQFRELIAIPMREALGSGEAFPGKIIIVDGLDECEGTRYQKEILDIIAQSVIDRTTPFRWIIGSRLEPHIVAKFNHSNIQHFTRHVEVTISRDLDPAIFRFLADKLVEIRDKHVLDETWPCEEDLCSLVEFSSGMFAHAHVISLFIDDDDSTSPMKQLKLVLGLAKQTIAEKGSKHPLKRLDVFYKTLILERLPREKFDVLGLILLVNHLVSEAHLIPGVAPFMRRCTQAQRCANVLGHSEQEFRFLCRSFHAVMILDSKDNLKFYHASFMEFLLDADRSGQFCIWSTDYFMQLLDYTKQVLDNVQIDKSQQPVLHLAWKHQQWREQYRCFVLVFTKALALVLLADSLDEQRCTVLQEWDFRKLGASGKILCFSHVPGMYTELCNRFGRNCGVKQILSLAWRSQGTGAFLSTLLGMEGSRFNHFILGHGKKSVLLGGITDAVILTPWNI